MVWIRWCSALNRPQRDEDPTKQYFQYPRYVGPFNQNVRSFRLHGLPGPQVCGKSFGTVVAAEFGVGRG